VGCGPANWGGSCDWCSDLKYDAIFSPTEAELKSRPIATIEEAIAAVALLQLDWVMENPEFAKPILAALEAFLRRKPLF
jgi:hypothetical protein